MEISLTVSPIKDAQGNIIGASKIARDITERKRIEEEIERRVIARTKQLTVVNTELRKEITKRKRAEQALARNAAQLKDNEHRLHLLAESIPQHVWGYLPDHTLNYSNQRRLDYYSLTFQDAQSKSWDTYIHPDDVAPALKLWQEAELQHKPYEMEVRLRRFDGSYRRFLSRGVPLYDERGELMQWFGTNTDIEDLKQAEVALRKAQMELAYATRVMSMGVLTASIAHEVNQPLTAVVNNGNACLRWLGRETPDLEALREALRDIITNGKRASDIIARIRSALKKAPVQVARLDINRVIMEVVELMRHEMQRHEVWLRTELAADLPPVSGDRVQLQQVLLNLLMNGIEAMRTVIDRPRELLIQAGRTASDGVFVVVRDTGVGLDPQILEGIFNAFFTTKPAGMGMGLSISHTIITAHGGQLWAECNPGSGATFQFILPRAGEEEGNA